jgi:hypothetical protein
VEESVHIESMRADGVLGLAFSGLSKITSPSLLAQLAIEHSDTVQNMFSLYLEPSYYSTNSRLIIGGYDLSLVTADAEWHYTPVAKVPGYDEYTYWAVRRCAHGYTAHTLDILHALHTHDILHARYIPYAIEYSPCTTPQVSITSMGLEWQKGEKNHRKEVSICGASSNCIAIVDSGSSVTEVPADVWPEFLKALLEGHDDCKTDEGGPYCDHCVADEFPSLAISMPPDETFYLPPEMYLEFGPGRHDGPCRWGKKQTASILLLHCPVRCLHTATALFYSLPPYCYCIALFAASILLLHCPIRCSPSCVMQGVVW